MVKLSKVVVLFALAVFTTGTHADAVESSDEYTMSADELKALKDSDKKPPTPPPVEENVEEGEVPEGEGGGNGPDVGYESSTFWIMLLAIYSMWLLVHGISTAKDLIPAIKELVGGKAKQEDTGFSGGKSRRGNKGAAGNNKSSTLKITDPGLLKKVAILVVGYFVWSTASSAIASSTSHLGTFDPYAALGVSSSDSPRDIKRAYRKLSMKWHPDKNKGGNEEEVKQTFMKINKAFKIITKMQKGEKITAADYSMDQ